MKFRNVVAIASTLTVLTSGLTILEAFNFPTPATAQETIFARLGDRNENVRRIQEALAKLGFFRVTPTGEFFDITQDAVIRFQRSRGLPETGFVSNSTANLLFSLAGSSQDRLCNRNVPNPELCPYVVMIPASPDSFDRIKQEIVRGGHLSQTVANAQMRPENHPRGPIIRFGDYRTRAEAEEFAGRLRNFSPDIRVEHLPRISS
jgi:hypothetical protein